jgi:hypothetical protein
MSYETTAKQAIVFWQENSESGVGEPALLIEPYFGCIQITQDGQRINIGYESVKEFCKVLKGMEEPT